MAGPPVVGIVAAMTTTFVGAINRRTRPRLMQTRRNGRTVERRSHRAATADEEEADMNAVSSEAVEELAVVEMEAVDAAMGEVD